MARRVPRPKMSSKRFAMFGLAPLVLVLEVEIMGRRCGSSREPVHFVRLPTCGFDGVVLLMCF
jgi:hypothetical protein